MAAWIDNLNSPQALGLALWQRAPQLVATLCLAWIAIQLGLLLTFQAPHPRAADSVGRASVAALPVQLATIVNAHLFGVYKSEAPDAANAPQTNMPLVLTGVMATADPEHGQAIIGQDAATTHLYSTGDTLPAGARLHSVYSDRVLLERNGGLETLTLPRNQNAPLALGQPAAASNGGQRLQVMAQTNPALLGGLVRTQPVFNQGRLGGYRVFPGGVRNSAVAFEKLGLRSGDTITAVNGTALDDPTRGAEVLQTISSASTMSVTVTRNGIPQEVTLNLDTVADLADSAANELSQSPPMLGGPRSNFGGARIGERRGGETGTQQPGTSSQQ